MLGGLRDALAVLSLGAEIAVLGGRDRLEGTAQAHTFGLEHLKAFAEPLDRRFLSVSPIV